MTDGLRALADAPWRTSTHTNAQSSNCVEVGPAHGVVGVRDTKRRSTCPIAVRPATWSAFVRDVKASRV